MKIKLAAAIPLLLISHVADATERITLACKFLDGSHGGRYAADVNQIIVEPAKPYIEFRAAQTIGTKDPFNYVFQNHDKDKLIIDVREGVFTAAAVRYGTAHALRIDPSSRNVVWSYIEQPRSIPGISAGDGVAHIHWDGTHRKSSATSTRTPSYSLSPSSSSGGSSHRLRPGTLPPASRRRTGDARPRARAPTPNLARPSRPSRLSASQLSMSVEPMMTDSIVFWGLLSPLCNHDARGLAFSVDDRRTAHRLAAAFKNHGTNHGTAVCKSGIGADARASSAERAGRPILQLHAAGHTGGQ